MDYYNQLKLEEAIKTECKYQYFYWECSKCHTPVSSIIEEGYGYFMCPECHFVLCEYDDGEVSLK